MKDSAASSRELLPLDDRRNRKSTSPAGLTPMKNEAGSARVEATGRVWDEMTARPCKVEAISSREGNIFGSADATGRGLIGISVSAEKIEGIPFAGASGVSDGFNSGAI